MSPRMSRSASTPAASASQTFHPGRRYVTEITAVNASSSPAMRNATGGASGGIPVRSADRIGVTRPVNAANGTGRKNAPATSGREHREKDWSQVPAADDVKDQRKTEPQADHESGKHKVAQGTLHRSTPSSARRTDQHVEARHIVVVRPGYATVVPLLKFGGVFLIEEVPQGQAHADAIRDGARDRGVQKRVVRQLDEFPRRCRRSRMRSSPTGHPARRAPAR